MTTKKSKEEKCIMAIKQKNKQNKCAEKDIKSKKKNCLNPWALCKFIFQRKN